jgi:hypothetical protein
MVARPAEPGSQAYLIAYGVIFLLISGNRVACVNSRLAIDFKKFLRSINALRIQ